MPLNLNMRCKIQPISSCKIRQSFPKLLMKVLQQCDSPADYLDLAPIEESSLSSCSVFLTKSSKYRLRFSRICQLNRAVLSTKLDRGREAGGVPARGVVIHSTFIAGFQSILFEKGLSSLAHSKIRFCALAFHV